MLFINVAITGVAGILVLAELLWREGLMPRSKGRVLVHILTACWVATWPYFLDFRSIFYIALAMFAVVGLSKFLRIFEAIHRTKRWTIGEFLYPLAIALAAWLSPEPAIFSAAVLQLGLADGMAAVIGAKLNFRPYTVLDQNKSVGGTATFFVTSLLITVLAVNWLGVGLVENLGVILLIPFLSAAAENVSVFGLDDLTVPMISVILLTAIL